MLKSCYGGYPKCIVLLSTAVAIFYDSFSHYVKYNFNIIEYRVVFSIFCKQIFLIIQFLDDERVRGSYIYVNETAK